MRRSIQPFCLALHRTQTPTLRSATLSEMMRWYAGPKRVSEGIRTPDPRDHNAVVNKT